MTMVGTSRNAPAATTPLAGSPFLTEHAATARVQLVTRRVATDPSPLSRPFPTRICGNIAPTGAGVFRILPGLRRRHVWARCGSEPLHPRGGYGVGLL